MGTLHTFARAYGWNMQDVEQLTPQQLRWLSFKIEQDKMSQ